MDFLGVSHIPSTNDYATHVCSPLAYVALNYPVAAATAVDSRHWFRLEKLTLIHDLSVASLERIQRNFLASMLTVHRSTRMHQSLSQISFRFWPPPSPIRGVAPITGIRRQDFVYAIFNPQFSEMFPITARTMVFTLPRSDTNVRWDTPEWWAAAIQAYLAKSPKVRVVVELTTEGGEPIHHVDRSRSHINLTTGRGSAMRAFSRHAVAIPLDRHRLGRSELREWLQRRLDVLRGECSSRRRNSGSRGLRCFWCLSGGGGGGAASTPFREPPPQRYVGPGSAFF